MKGKRGTDPCKIRPGEGGSRQKIILALVLILETDRSTNEQVKSSTWADLVKDPCDNAIKHRKNSLLSKVKGRKFKRNNKDLLRGFSSCTSQDRMREGRDTCYADSYANSVSLSLTDGGRGATCWTLGANRKLIQRGNNDRLMRSVLFALDVKTYLTDGKERNFNPTWQPWKGGRKSANAAPQEGRIYFCFATVNKQCTAVLRCHFAVSKSKISTTRNGKQNRSESWLLLLLVAATAQNAVSFRYGRSVTQPRPPYRILHREKHSHRRLGTK